LWDFHVTALLRPVAEPVGADDRRRMDHHPVAEHAVVVEHHVRVEDDVKLDNQIQIGHNCRIGRHTAIAGCVGIAGSTRIGSNCKIGGAAYLNGHIEICDDVMLGGGTGVYRSITKPGIYSGSNLELPHVQWQHVQTALRKLPELLRRVRRLERGGAAQGDNTSDEAGGNP